MKCLRKKQKQLKVKKAIVCQMALCIKAIQKTMQQVSLEFLTFVNLPVILIHLYGAILSRFMTPTAGFSDWSKYCFT